jgi:hypothetical protein
MKNLFSKRNVIILIALLLISLSFGCTKEEKLQGTAYDIESNEFVILGELEDINISSLSNPESGSFIFDEKKVVFSAEKIKSNEKDNIIYNTYEGIANIEDEEFLITLSGSEKGLSGMIYTEETREVKFGFVVSYENTEDIINKMKTAMEDVESSTEDSLTYTNHELGIEIEFPETWKGKYIVQKFENSIEVLSKKVNEESNFQGMLFTIKREVGELITEEDLNQSPVNEKIIGKNKGYTYILRLPSDVQYLPDNQNLTEEYKSMNSKINEIVEKTKFIGNLYPEAKNKDFKVVGSAFFTMEIPKDFEVKESVEEMTWNFYNDDKNIGKIRFISYFSNSEKEENGYLFSNLENKDLLRKVEILVSSEEIEKDDFEIIKSSFKFLGGPNTSIDIKTRAQQYYQYGGKKVFGKIKEIVQENGNIIGIKIEEFQFSQDKETEDESVPVKMFNEPLEYSVNGSGNNVIILTPPDYTRHSRYGFITLDNLIDNYKFQDYYFDFIIGSDEEIKIIIEKYIPNNRLLPDMEVEFSYYEMETGQAVNWKENISGYTIKDLVNYWINEMYKEEVVYAVDEVGENIFKDLKVINVVERDNLIILDLNSIFLHFDKVNSQPSYFTNRLKYLLDQVTDAELLDVLIEGDGSRSIIGDDGLIIRETNIDNSSSKDAGYLYINEEYGFTFKIPDKWEGKYKIQESEGENYSRVSFLYTGYQYEDGSFQEFFSIMINDEKTFNQYENKYEELILAKEEGYVFYYSTPLDSGIDNEEAAEEFTNLNINHVEVKELFSID